MKQHNPLYIVQGTSKSKLTSLTWGATAWCNEVCGASWCSWAVGGRGRGWLVSNIKKLAMARKSELYKEMRSKTLPYIE